MTLETSVSRQSYPTSRPELGRADAQPWADACPRITVVCSARNDYDNLKTTLDSVYRLPVAIHEVLAFDDASRDNTSEKVMYNFGDHPNFTLVTYANSKGRAAARNEAILRSSGEYILFLDPGATLDQHSFERLIGECPHYNIVYPSTEDLASASYERFRAAHESYIKFSHCYLIRRSSLYCFNGLFYDTALEEPFCDFDFFCRAQVFGLTAFLVKDAGCKVAPPRGGTAGAGECSSEAAAPASRDRAPGDSQALFQAIYHDMGALATIGLILQELAEARPATIRSVLELSGWVDYVNRKRKEILLNNNSFLYRYRNSYFKKMCDGHFTLIEITNACPNKCASCTRGVPLLKDYQFMTIEELETALKSLEGWRRPVGLFGGEPTVHPQFPEMCEVLGKYFPKQQRALFTCGGKAFIKHRKLIDDTFGIINYNDHATPTYHQPIFVSSSEVVKDKKMRDVLIQRCWVEQVFCHIITKRGGFFCEVASTLDLLHNGKGGFPLEPGWWKRDAAQCQAQIEEYCSKCGCCLPLEAIPDNSQREIMSPGQYRMLQDCISEKHCRVELYDRTHDAFSIFDATGSKQENYSCLDHKSYWYKENWLDTREQREPVGEYWRE